MLSWKSIALSSAVPLPRIGVVPRGSDDEKKLTVVGTSSVAEPP
jgi:hypothetical protein